MTDDSMHEIEMHPPVKLKQSTSIHRSFQFASSLIQVLKMLKK